ncbi:MAG: LysR family transcriptional regulator [Clostridiaceae bacterium]|nr:LysR family transcriptional regulator [Clostridiaceae bacterium]
MNFRHLKIFIAVCEEKSMTRAAKRLYITQPSVSQVIWELEEHYHVKLFERLSKKIFITAAGEQLLSYAYHITSLNQELNETMKNNSFEKTIHLGATVTIGTYLLPQILAAAIKSYKNKLEINIAVENTAFIEKNILNSKIDIGLVEGEIQSKDIKTNSFFQDELVIICNKNSSLAKKASLTIHDLKDKGFLMREEGSGSRTLFVNAMHAKGISYTIKGVFNNTEAIKNATLHGLGLGIVSKASLLSTDTDLYVLHISNFELKRFFSIVYHKNKYLSEELSYLIDYVLKNYTKLTD